MSEPDWNSLRGEDYTRAWMDHYLPHIYDRYYRPRTVEMFRARYPGCCLRCGWSVSSHGTSGYGLRADCGGRGSPAALAGDLPERDAEVT